MIHANVPIYYMENTFSLPTVEKLGTEILPSDINIRHHFLDEFSSLAILPYLSEAPQVNVPIEEDNKVCVEEREEAIDEAGSEVEVTKVTLGTGLKRMTRSSTKMQANLSPASKKALGKSTCFILTESQEYS